MDITTNREVIWKRIKAGGPTSIITSGKEQISSVAPKLLKEYEKEINDSNIKPICINCEVITDPVFYFRNIFITIWDLIPHEYKTITKMFKEAIESCKETSTIDAIMENFMSIVKSEINMHFLLILENFDKAVAVLEEPDLMKVRGMSSYINMLTISYKPLEILATENKKEDYFCNQFKAFII